MDWPRQNIKACNFQNQYHTFMLKSSILLAVLCSFASAQSGCIQIVKDGLTFGFDPTDYLFYRTASEGQLRGARVVPSARGQCMQQEGLTLSLDDKRVIGTRFAWVITGGPRQSFEPKAVLGVTSPFVRQTLGVNRFRLKVNRDDMNMCLTANDQDFLDVAPCGIASVFTVTQPTR